VEAADLGVQASQQELFWTELSLQEILQPEKDGTQGKDRKTKRQASGYWMDSIGIRCGEHQRRPGLHILSASSMTIGVEENTMLQLFKN
jgi:hypothetical protein